mgnify:CR=1 FL=1|jgi:nucleoside-diphosphate-sugar epimerase
MKTKPSVLLTGASGTVGYEVLQQLLAADTCELFVFDIKTPRTEKLFSAFAQNIHLIYGNIANGADVARIPLGMDMVIHLAAIIPPTADQKPNLAWKVNVNGTRNLVFHLEMTSPRAFLLFSSSVAVYGDRLHNPHIKVGDELRCSTGDLYAQTKVECERIVQQSDVKWSIFRLTAIMRNHKISPLMFHMPLSTLMEICTPEDTARAFVKALERQTELCGKVYNLGGGKDCLITYRDFLIRSFKMYGLGKLNFPENAFAEHNFHCGIFSDGDKLENLLHFRHDNLDTYFAYTRKHIPRWLYVLAVVFRMPVKLYLLLYSEPYRAYISHNKGQMQRFFFAPKQIVMPKL